MYILYVLGEVLKLLCKTTSTRCIHKRLCYNLLWLLMALLHDADVILGRSVEDRASVPVYWLAWTRSSQVRRRIHWFRRPGAQDERAVRPGRTNHRSLQVKCLISLIYSLINFRQIVLSTASLSELIANFSIHRTSVCHRFFCINTYTMDWISNTVPS